MDGWFTGLSLILFAAVSCATTTDSVSGADLDVTVERIRAKILSLKIPQMRHTVENLRKELKLSHAAKMELLDHNSHVITGRIRFSENYVIDMYLPISLNGEKLENDRMKDSWECGDCIVGWAGIYKRGLWESRRVFQPVEGYGDKVVEELFVANLTDVDNEWLLNQKLELLGLDACKIGNAAISYCGGASPQGVLRVRAPLSPGYDLVWERTCIFETSPVSSAIRGDLPVRYFR
jgi:hypothetical protein